MPTEPNSGEVWFAELGMVEKSRPVLVLAFPSTEDARALAVVAPLTSQIRGMRGEVGRRSFRPACIGGGRFERLSFKNNRFHRLAHPPAVARAKAALPASPWDMACSRMRFLPVPEFGSHEGF